MNNIVISKDQKISAGPLELTDPLSSWSHSWNKNINMEGFVVFRSRVRNIFMPSLSLCEHFFPSTPFPWVSWDDSFLSYLSPLPWHWKAILWPQVSICMWVHILTTSKSWPWLLRPPAPSLALGRCSMCLMVWGFRLVVKWNPFMNSWMTGSLELCKKWQSPNQES